MTINPSPFSPSIIHSRMLLVGLGEYATSEVPGAGNNPRIVEYHQTTSLRASQDSVAWCSSFVCWVAKQVGLKTHPANAWAESWLNWGAKVKWPVPGSIVVFKNHVGLVVKATGSLVYTLGGNQSDAVNIKAYPIGSVLSYRVARAEDVIAPAQATPAVAVASTDETSDPSSEGETQLS
jgi:uncharacterized protein (TIGR02594 family)